MIDRLPQTAGTTPANDNPRPRTHPDEICRDTEMSPAERLRVLKAWREDAEVENDPILDEIDEAIAQLQDSSS